MDEHLRPQEPLGDVPDADILLLSGLCISNRESVSMNAQLD